MDVAASEAVEDLPGAGPFGELVFAGLEFSLGLEEAQEGELPAVAEDADAGELVADLARGGSAIDFDNGAGRRGLRGGKKRGGRGGEHDEEGGAGPEQASFHPMVPR